MSAFVSALGVAIEDLRERAYELNQLDGWAGDGDLGVTCSTAAAAVSRLLPSLEGMTVEMRLRQLGTTIAKDAPSTAGTLIAAGLLRAGQAADNAKADASTLATLLRSALDGIADLGRAEPGSKTMLDALGPAVQAAAFSAAAGQSLAAALLSAAHAADLGAKSTVSMRPRHGRAGWLPDRSVGHEDAGARLVAIVLSAVARSVSSEPGPISYKVVKE